MIPGTGRTNGNIDIGRAVNLEIAGKKTDGELADIAIGVGRTTGEGADVEADAVILGAVNRLGKVVLIAARAGEGSSNLILAVIIPVGVLA